MSFSQPHPKIKVYDDVYDWSQQQSIYLKCLGSPYKVGWSDSITEPEQFMHSTITEEMWKHRLQIDQSLDDFYNLLFNSKPYKGMANNEVCQTVINCDTISDSHTKHIHPNQEVLLYYVNTDWKDGWGGETFFYDEKGQEIIFTSPYTPNRVIQFSGDLVHRFAGPTMSGPKFRFSISTFFWKQKEQEPIRKNK